MASAKEIKNRIRSLDATKRITRAMEMVASSKLRRAQARVMACRPYFETLYSTLQNMAGTNRDFSSPYLTERNSSKAVYIVIAGDRGLAGGYNSNALKAAMARLDRDSQVLPMGKKAVDYFHSRGVPIVTDRYREAEAVSVEDCFALADDLCKGYLSGSFGRVHVVYTDFVSVLSQVPDTKQLLPVLRQEAAKPEREILYEPDRDTVFGTIVPQYLGGMIYGALCESRAAEQAARRTAMDAATSNARELIGQLSLQYNRARQAAITQEITEIVAGSR